MDKAGETLPASAPSPLGGRIYSVRGLAVMLDSDLAEVYGVETYRVNEAVKRNPERFEHPYSFQLFQNEWDVLRSQIAISNTGRGGRRYLPRVFTEHGAVMLASVLKSPRAIQASRAVVETFVRLRHVMETNLALAHRLDELAAKVDKHDRTFTVVFEELKRLAVDIVPEAPRGRIGFRTNKERGISGRARKG